MEQIIWTAGTEKRFSEFISKFNEKDKIAIVSHIADLDGVTSAKVINTAVSADFIKFVDYHEINLDFAKELKKEKIKFVIISDLMIKDIDFIKECEKLAELLIIDHHTFEVDYNSTKTIFLNAEGYCAAYLSYYLFSKVTDLSKFDWLVACACVSDWCYKSNAAWMIEIYEKYNQVFIPTIEGVKKSKFYDLVLDLSRAIVYFRSTEKDVRKIFDKLNGEKFGNISDLADYAKVVADEIQMNVKKFEKEKIKLRDGYYYEFESKFPIKSIVSTDVSERNQDKTIIIGFRAGKNLEFSARRQDGKVDLNATFAEIVEGLENSSAGGHFKATGGYISLKDKDKFLEKLKNL